MGKKMNLGLVAVVVISIVLVLMISLSKKRTQTVSLPAPEPEISLPAPEPEISLPAPEPKLVKAEIHVVEPPKEMRGEDIVPARPRTRIEERELWSGNRGYVILDGEYVYSGIVTIVREVVSIE